MVCIFEEKEAAKRLKPVLKNQTNYGENIMYAMPQIQPPTVLLVDGDEQQSNSRKQELEAQGYRVVCTHSGQEAFETFERERIDAVVVDFLLPDMHVLDLIDGIAEKHCRLPIVVNSPYAHCHQNFRYWAADAIFDKSIDSRSQLPELVTALL
jgi:DNA-binding NtrC family response regulator